MSDMTGRSLLAASAATAVALVGCTSGHDEASPTPTNHASSPAPPATARVPSVVGMVLSGATKALGRRGFNIQAGSARVSSAPEETVIAQIPAAGTLANPSSTVIVTISAGHHPRGRRVVIGMCDLVYLPPSGTPPPPCIGGVTSVPVKRA
jgi:hypothetical protein